MDYNTFVHKYAAKLTPHEPDRFLGLDNKDQPINIHNLLSIEAAIREMKTAGAAEKFCRRMTWANNNIDVPVISLSLFPSLNIFPAEC